MITVSFIEVVLLVLIVLLISGVRGLNSLLNDFSFDIYLIFNIISLTAFAISLLLESVRDAIEYVFESKSWKCYLTNILAIIAGGYMYFKFLYNLPGTSKIAGTVFMIIYYAVYLLAIGIFYLIENNTNAETSAHSNILIGILIAIIFLFFAVINIWNVGYTITKNTIASDNNISYYIIEDKGVSIYDSTDGRIGILGGYRVTSKYTMSCKDMVVYPAYVENRYTRKADLSFTAVYYGSDRLGFVESCKLTSYYNNAVMPELISKREEVINQYYPRTPGFIINMCIRLYYHAPLGSLHIAE